MGRAAPDSDDLGAQRLRAALRATLLDVDDCVLVGRYELGTQLGFGGMAVVHRGWDPELKRAVAIKFVSLSGVAADVVLREARAMASVVHRHVVPVYDVGRRASEAYLVMALMEDGTLADWLERSSPTALERMAKLVEAGEGLAAAHAVGVVHHDFKPTNVLLDGAGHACVSDFGLSSVMHSTASMITASGSTGEQSSVRGGTPGFAPPERVDGAVGDVRSDQYSYCVTVAMVLADCVGMPPQPERALAIARRLVEAPPRGLRSGVGRALVRGLSSAPDERYPSMNALLAALRPTSSSRWRRWGVGFLGLALMGAVGLGKQEPAAVVRVAPPHIDNATSPLDATASDSAVKALLMFSELARYADAVDAAEAYAATAWSLGTPHDTRVTADLMLQLGLIAIERSRADEASARLMKAVEYADAARWNQGVASAHIALIRTLEEGAGRRAKALEHERFARAALRRMDHASPGLELSLELSIGTSEFGGDHFDHAEAAARRAIEVGEAHGLDERYWAYFDLAQVLIERRKYDDGEAACKRALEIAESEGASIRDVLLVRDSLKDFASLRGDVTAARVQAEALLPLFVSHYGAHDERTVETMFNLAMLREATGDYDGAFALYERAIEALRDWHRDDVAMLAKTYGGLAQAKAMHGDLDEAEVLYSKALVELESAGAGDDPNTVQWRAQLGGIEMERGHPLAAKKHLDLAIEAADRIGDSGRAGQATALAYRGRIHADQGRLDAARLDLRRAVEAGRGTIDALHPDQVWEARVLASVESQRGQPEAAQKILDNVLTALQGAGLRHGLGWASSAFELAELLGDSNGDGDLARARRLAEQARVEFAKSPDAAAETESVELWLAKHAP